MRNTLKSAGDGVKQEKGGKVKRRSTGIFRGVASWATRAARRLGATSLSVRNMASGDDVRKLDGTDTRSQRGVHETEDFLKGSHRMRRRLLLSAGPVLLALAALALAPGCDSGPKTHPVKGKVVFEGGDVKRLAEGTVVFRSVSQPDLFAYGEIQEDGSFTMATKQTGVKEKPGAVEGEHQVKINLPEGDPEEGVRPIIARQFLDFETSKLRVKVPSEGEITLKVTRSR